MSPNFCVSRAFEKGNLHKNVKKYPKNAPLRLKTRFTLITAKGKKALIRNFMKYTVSLTPREITSRN